MLEYVALFVLIFVGVVLFYAIIAIHDIPGQIAHDRHHPHEDAIHAAGWVSLFTLHALWPFLWIWAMAYKPNRGWGFDAGAGENAAALPGAVEQLQRRVAELEAERRQGRVAPPRPAVPATVVGWQPPPSPSEPPATVPDAKRGTG